MTSVSSSSQFSRFPAIAHPSSKRFNSPLDIRGKSRDGFGNGELIRSESSASTNGRRRSSSLRHPSRSLDLNQSNEERPRLPIFGKEQTTNEREKRDLFVQVNVRRVFFPRLAVLISTLRVPIGFVWMNWKCP